MNKTQSTVTILVDVEHITTDRTNLPVLVKQLTKLISEQYELKTHLNCQQTKRTVAHQTRRRAEQTENTRISDFYIINEDSFMNFRVQSYFSITLYLIHKI